MFHRQSFENSRTDGFPVLEIGNGSPQEDGHPRRFVPLKQTRLKGEVVGPLASMRLTQTYGYRGEECDKVLEAFYRFPLPGDAAVRSVTVRFGNVSIQTELKERRQATADYDQAKKEGRQAVLATRESPDVFTLRIAGLRPNEEIVVDTYYVQLARNEGAGWSLRIPLTTTPRYVRSDEFTAPHAQGQPLSLLRDPGHRFAIDLNVLECGSVESPTHKLDVARDGEACRVRLRDGEVLPDRDCVVCWRPAQPQDHVGLTVLLEDAPGTEHIYFLALVAPPATFDRGSGIPREAIILVDHSGSMSGAKWQAADWAVERFLSDLKPADSFALGLFHSTMQWFDAQPRAASEDAVREAIGFLKKHTDSGGTELGVALEQALSLKRSDGEAARHVLIITDAQVTDAGRILRLADEESKQLHPRRISVLCIDAAPNSLLATELAERSGGVARFLTSQPEEGDITTALEEVLADWSEPILSGLKLEVNRADLETAGRHISQSSQAGWSAIDLGDLPAGRPVWCAGRFPRTGAGEIIFRTTAGKGQKLATCSSKPRPAVESRPVIRPLFGARRILGLEQLIHSGSHDVNERLRCLGYDPQNVLAKGTQKVYAENARNELQTALSGLLVEESLLYGLASAETAFVAVRSEPGKPVESAVVVGSAFPAGWSEEGVAVGAMLSMNTMMPSMHSLGPACAYYDSGAAGIALGMVASGFDPGIARAMPAAILREVHDVVPESALLFEGVPKFEDGRATLFDSTNTAANWDLPDPATFNFLNVEWFEGTSDPKMLDRGLCLLLYVEDLAAPRARVSLAEILRSGGKRPLNIRWRPGQGVRLVLVDPNGVWGSTAPTLRASLGVG